MTIQDYSMITLDFETKAIVPGTPCLPEPVGVAVRFPDGSSCYYAWGHPTGNNCTYADMYDLMREWWSQPWLTHNGCTFDVPIAQHWFKLPPRDPLLTHDTLFMLFLHDPHAPSLALKDAAVRLLGMQPDAQTALHEWIIGAGLCRTAKQAGAFISEAPGDLVGEYACADVDMTYALYEYLRGKVEHMQVAYDRERLLAPILVEMQTTGVRLDRERLAADLIEASDELLRLDVAIKKMLRAPELNLDSDADLVTALQAQGYYGFLLTATGALSASKESLDIVLCDDPALRMALRRRGKLATLVRTFLEPWLTQSAATGRLYPTYNQVRNPDGYGTRTGRLSSSNPNMTNVPNDMGDSLPLMKSYVLPECGDEWSCADFKSQEPRIAAHFEDGVLLDAYRNNPELDVYTFVAELANVTRKQAKVVFLGLLYGMGAGTLADNLGIGKSEAIKLRDAVRAAVPGLSELVATCTRYFRKGVSLTTLGGREYFCEPPAQGFTFEYKATNVLVQGSAADQSKEALVYAAPRLAELGARIVTFVHDEYSVSHRPEHRDAVYQIIRESAQALAIDVPMLMDIHTGDNWSEAKQ